MPRLQIPNAISPQGGLTGAVRAPAEALSNTGAVQAAGAMGNAVAGAVQGIQDYRNALQNATDEAEAVRIQAEWKRDDEEMMKAQLSQGYNPDLGTDAFNVSKIAANERSKALIESNKALSKPAKRKMLLALQQKVAERDVDTSQRAFKAQREFSTASMVDSATKLAELGDLAGASKILDVATKNGLIDHESRLKAEKKLPEIYENKQMANKYYTDPQGLVDDIKAGLYPNVQEEHKRAMLSSAMVAVSRNQSEVTQSLVQKRLKNEFIPQKTYDDLLATKQISLDQWNDLTAASRQRVPITQAQAEAFETFKKDYLDNKPVTVPAIDAALKSDKITLAQRNDLVEVLQSGSSAKTERARKQGMLVTTEGVDNAIKMIELVKPNDFDSLTKANIAMMNAQVPDFTLEELVKYAKEKFAPETSIRWKHADEFVGKLATVIDDSYKLSDELIFKRLMSSGKTVEREIATAKVTDRKVNLVRLRFAAREAFKAEIEKGKSIKDAETAATAVYRDYIPSLFLKDIAPKTPIIFDADAYKKMNEAAKGEQK